MLSFKGVYIQRDLGHMAEEELVSLGVLFGDEVVDRVKNCHDTLTNYYIYT